MTRCNNWLFFDNNYDAIYVLGHPWISTSADTSIYRYIK